MPDVKADVKVELFYADWCGHCQRFKPEWAKLKKMLEDNGMKWAEYESEKDGNKMEEENIRGYPTIKITINSNKQEYDGMRNALAILDAIKQPNKMATQNAGNSGKFHQCGGARQGFTPRVKNNKNATKNEEYYKIKYFKYKAKYLKRRGELNGEF